MKKYSRKLKVFIFVNLFNIILILLVAGVSVRLRLFNLRISDEINYITAKIVEQENNLKVYRSELAIVTEPRSLMSLYSSYYKVKSIALLPKVTQIKDVDRVVGYLNGTTVYSRLY